VGSRTDPRLAHRTPPPGPATTNATPPCPRPWSAGQPSTPSPRRIARGRPATRQQRRTLHTRQLIFSNTL